MTDSHEQLSNLSPEQRALLLLRLKKQKRQEAKEGDQAIVYQGRDTREFPLSYAQQRFWFLEQLEKGSVEYNFAMTFSLKGRLHISAFEKSINDIMRRHESLRTIFKEVDGQPIQVISLAQTIPINKIDLTHFAKYEQTEKIKKLAQDDAAAPFDLARGPLLRVSLLKLGDEDHVLFLTTHHIVFDGWSKAIFYRELSSLYKAHVNSTCVNLPDLKVQYPDFSFWQNQQFDKSRLAGQLDYWKKHLAGAPPVVSFPTDWTRDHSVKTIVDAERFSIDPELVGKLKQLCRELKTTMFSAVFAAFSLLLSRYSGSKDMVIGTPMVDRSHRETENLIGLFLNTIALRVDLTAEPSFRQLLYQIGQAWRDALDNQDLPFQKLVEALHPERNLQYSPIFQVMFILQSAPKEEIDLTGLKVIPLKLRKILPGTNYDITFSLEEKPDELAGVIEYNSNLYTPETIFRIVENFKILLQNLLDSPEQSVSTLPMLSAADKELQLEWNPAGTVFDESLCLHDLFERQVEKSPHSIAAVYRQEQLSYRELNKQANRIAHRLLKMKLEKNSIVGIYTERSLDMLASVIGVLKSGYTYLPLDPTYPTNRVAFMLEDSRAAAVLTQVKLKDTIPGETGNVLCVDEDFDEADDTLGVNPGSRADPDDVAYVIYTSGSTGKPKGVRVPHKAVVNFLHSMRCEPGISDRDTLYSVTTLSFDICLLELFLPITVGARVVIADSEVVYDGNRLLEEVEASQATIMQATPATWQLLLDAGWQEKLPLKILCGGEALSAQLASRLINKGESLWNLYGPTETTIWSTVFRVDTNFTLSQAVPIGRPITNTQVFILDESLQLVPIGAAGELHIGGKGLAHGYLDRPELTAQKFIENPFADDPQERLYKTGDLARYRADGSIEYLGRIDQQVKLRGFRVELGEIESILAEHETVRKSAVMIREDEPGDRRLVAYLVAEKSRTLSFSDLRTFVRSKLPEYMLPAAFVLLQRLPLTANGKLDRNALPMPEGERQSEEVLVEPRSDLERQLAGIWSEVLRLERLGIHDNFFDLGGHSLMATQVVSRIRSQLSVELPLSEIFERSSVAELAPVVESLLDNGNLECTGVIPIADRDGELPLSFAQERLWFLDQLEPGSSAYNMPLALRLKGELRVEVLKNSLIAIVKRQEGLRTHFTLNQGTPFQVIDDIGIELQKDDIADLTSDTFEDEVKARIDAEALLPFDLSTGPLIRFRLLRLSEREHVLMLTMHHVISDGWSLGILFRELGACYTAFSSGLQPELPELPIQYADFASWQREWLSGKVLASQLDYWKNQLDGLSVLELPTDRPRPPTQTFNGAIVRNSLPKKFEAELEQFSQQRGVSVFMSLLVAFAALMHRYSGQEDIVVGSPIANRNRSELEDLIGIFVNSLVMRTDVSGNPSFTELVERVKRAVLGAYDHQDLPFEKLVDEMHPDRDRSRNPLFQVMFTLQNASAEKLELPGLTLETGGHDIQVTRFDLEVHIWQKPDTFNINFIYNTDLFDETTINRLSLHYQRLLEVMVASPETLITDAPMLTARERQQLLIDWNRTAADYSRHETLHGLFEKQVDSTPEAIALEFDQQTLSYFELDERANRLARYLRGNGVGAGDLVGVFMERSLEMVVTLCGIFKSGAAYVPMDPEYPRERIAFMADETRIPVLLTQEHLSERLPPTDSKIVCVDTQWEIIASKSGSRITTTATGEDPSYVIYTSGSTGKPKAVVNSHKAIVNHLLWMKETYPLTGDDRVLQKTPYSFDVSVWEIFWPLVAGNRLVMARPGGHKDPAYLASVIEEKKITTIHFVASMLKSFLEHAPRGTTRGLKRVISSGEAVSYELQEQFFKASNAQLINLYGPTEAAVHVTRWECQPGDDRHVVPIGKPIANTRMYILDPHMQPVPVGVPGELHIGGVQVAQGYLNRPELTAEKFIADPFSDDASARLYKTGDQVRYLADANIEYLGRIDHQIKLRGFRIELGEIESILSDHDAVRDAVAVVREDEPGDKQLVAYLVLKTGTGVAPSVNDLRTFLRAKLPDFMVPSAFVMLDRFPLSANGKLDRNALPVPGDVRASLGTEYTAPRNELEQQLANIWVEVLKLERVGVHDNFFDLGGHSLMATQVVSRIRTRLGAELPLSEMFGNSTVSELAPVVQSLLDERAEEEVDVIPVADRDGNLPLSFAQERLWFLDQLEPGGSAYNIPLALRLKGKLNVSALQSSINAIYERQQGLRTRFVLQQGKPFQIIDDVLIELEQDNLSALNPEALPDEVRKQIAAEASKPFDLSTGPLLRCRLLCLSDLEHVLLMTMHHVISDGWSLGVLFRELGIFYEAYKQDKNPVLTEMPIQYADFAVWQRGWLSGEVLAKQLSFWRKNLEDLPTLNLPTDRPRPPVQTYTGSSEKLALEVGLSDQLNALSRREGVTLFMTMLAAFAALLHRYSGQDDIVVGTPIANRNRAELENLIGFFVNSLVMRTDVSGNPKFTELIQRVNSNSLKAYEHQDLPFEKLVDEIQPDRDLSHNPLFQVMFALQNAPIGSLELEGLTLETIRQEVRVSAFDLECHVVEKADRLAIAFVYNTDLFDASTIRRMMTHYRRLLEASVAAPDTTVGELEILEDDEKQLMLRQWNKTQADYVANESLHSLFEQQARTTPAATAVRFEQQSLDYAELERRANGMASLLLARGVEPGQFVGIFLERSIDLVVAVLGILKAGAAYVPLDPEYPEAHLEYLVADSNIRVLLAQQKFSDRLPSAVRDVVFVDADIFPETPEATELPIVASDDLAYVIYTSGSTGKPKGVMVSHGAVVNHACWMQELFKLEQDDRLLQKSPISFDASVCEIFVPLLNGACVVLAVPGGDRDIDYLIREVRDNEITTLILVPSALRILLQNLQDPADLASLKRMGCGGEALTRELKQAYYEKCSAPLFNLYGPTESTIDATSFLCEPDFDRDSIPIGYPVSNKQAYILDRRLHPVPIGVHGELHIGGAGLARGYLNQPELTAEKFIADPFSAAADARLYKTGDLARYYDDGSIEYVGRIDNQVKVRGFRIELGEIETVLTQNEFIEECAALIYEDLQGNKNIAAFFVSDDSVSTLALRNYLRKKLPHYMIPSLLTKLEQIPVTPNGKTDYRALLTQTKGKTIRDSVYNSPETAAEKKIAGIWETLLNVDRIDVGDNFFDVGGHSLLLIQAKSVIEKEVGVSVPLVDFFHQTLGQIATYCEKNQPSGTGIEEI